MSRILRKLSSEFPLQITARTNNKEFFPIPMAEAWEVFSDYLYSMHHAYGLRILQFVLMDNHFHMILRDPDLNLSVAMRHFMRETSREISRLSGRINRVWGRPYHSSIIASPRYFLHAYKYNYRNPVAAGICRHPEEYRWSTLQILLGQRHGIIPLEPDETLFEDVEGTLAWLNRKYSDDEVEAIQTGFRRKLFRLPKDPKSGRHHHLLNPENLPMSRRVPEL